MVTTEVADPDRHVRVVSQSLSLSVSDPSESSSSDEYCRRLDFKNIDHQNDSWPTAIHYPRYWKKHCQILKSQNQQNLLKGSLL